MDQAQSRFSSAFDKFALTPGPLLNASDLSTWNGTVQDGSAEAQSSGVSSRVCDRCITKKVKCDLQRPSCSRCNEGGWPCVYSVTKRKPGPAKGFRRRSGNARTQAGQQGRGSADNSVSQTSEEAPEHYHSATRTTKRRRGSASPEDTDFPVATDFSLQPEQERDLLELFFKHIQPSFPVLRKHHFSLQYDHGLVDRHILVTICAITAKILGPIPFWSSSDVDDCLNSLLREEVIDVDSSSRPGIDRFKQAGLLAFYEFHQSPGSRAWSRIGQLTRQAYQNGLHQLDNPQLCPLYENATLTEDDIREWRYVWWCIYCLDSYSNVTNATPFVIEPESIRTALVGPPNDYTTMIGMPTSSAIFLAPDTESLWKTVKEVMVGGGDFNFNMHILSNTLLREAATLHRLRAQNPSERVLQRLAAMGKHLSAVRLAMPARYLNPCRHVMANESNVDHCARLVCALHFQMSRILISLPLFVNGTEQEWHERWQQVLEYGEDVVAIVREWDGQFSSSVEPAICFIIYAVIQLLHLHRKCGLNLDSEVMARIGTDIDVLMLFLEQFGTLWNLPRVLMNLSDRFMQAYSYSMEPKAVEQVLRSFQSMLQSTGIKANTLPPPPGVLAVGQNMEDPNTFTQGFDFSHWDFATDFSNMADFGPQ